MTLINWDGPYYYIDPSDFSITPAGGTPTAGEEAVPTYGLNGGPGWTVGVVGGSTLGGGRPGPQCESTLDKLFFFHDRAYDLNPQPILPDADLKLINDMAKLSDRQLADPEDSFYAGIVTLALLTRLAEDAPTSLPSLPKIAFITLDALHNIERGLAGLPPTEQAQAVELLGNVLSGATLSPFAATTTALGDTLSFAKTGLPDPTPQNTVLDLVTDHAGSHSADPAHHALSALEDVAPPELLVAEQHINAHGHDPGLWLV